MDCETCNGNGEITCPGEALHQAKPTPDEQKSCPICHGSGWITCPTCGGLGRLD